MQLKDSPSRQIAVTLTPTQAKQLANTIRIELASRWQEEWLTPELRREDLGKARTLLDLYTDQLERLEWGEPDGDVELRFDRDRLEDLAQNLREGGEECIADSACSGDDARDVEQQGRDMVAAARAINDALESGVAPAGLA